MQYVHISILGDCETSKAITLFEDDERFKAVERPADREDLYKIYLVDLHKKVYAA